MNKTLAIVVIILAVILIVLAIIIFVTPRSNTGSNSATSTGNLFSTSTTTSATQSNTQPGNSENPSVLSLKTTNGGTVVVKNFKQAASTVTDPDVPGYYYLAGGADEQVSKAPYQIFYYDSDDSFGITLYAEPLGTNRLAAEQQLMQILGLSESEMCNLNYYVGIQTGLNANYEHENLGFSFCPGAVELPQ